MNQKILDKLKKLVNHAESARSIGQKKEAEAFDEQIQVLLKKHGISIEQVAEHTLKSEEIGMDLVWNKPRKLEQWYYPLHSVIGMANECFGLFSNDGLAYIGFKEDRVKACRQMRYFESLFASKRAAYGVEAFNTAVTAPSGMSFYFSGAPDRRTSYVTGLVQGFTAQIIRDRTEEFFAKQEQQSEALTICEQSRLEKKVQRIQEFFDSRVPKSDENGESIELPPEQVLVEMSSYEEGVRDGRRIKLSDLELEEAESFGEGLVKK